MAQYENVSLLNTPEEAQKEAAISSLQIPPPTSPHLLLTHYIVPINKTKWVNESVICIDQINKYMFS